MLRGEDPYVQHSEQVCLPNAEHLHTSEIDNRNPFLQICSLAVYVEIALSCFGDKLEGFFVLLKQDVCMMPSLQQIKTLVWEMYRDSNPFSSTEK